MPSQLTASSAPINKEMSHAWSVADIPDQSGRTALITGTSGLGYETALALAGANASVILAGRNARKGDDAIKAIRAIHPSAKLTFEAVDLGSLASIRTVADRIRTTHVHLDLLINNAGVMAPPTRQTTTDGFELQFGTNYLGHFALTAHLLPLLKNGNASRIVNVSSGYHRIGAAIHFDDLQWTRRYKPWSAYAQSKLAMILMTLELQRHSDRHHWGILSTAAHPGYARTNLIKNGPGNDGLRGKLGALLGCFMSQSAAEGALPTLLAATSPDAVPGGYYGPTGRFELTGPPSVAKISDQAKDPTLAARLWKVSEELTSVTLQ